MKNLIKFFVLTFFFVNIFFISVLGAAAGDPAPAPAQPTLLPTPSGTTGGCSTLPASMNYTGNCGNYTLNDMVSIVLKISEFILGLVGALALLAFVIGGLMWILSAGNAEWVTRGKQAIIGAVIGLAIVFTSFMIIQLVYSALGIEKAAEGKWAVSSWFSK